jgi:adenine C2-methylase RlmN of 23S rRNA A2503 and tRNA A37
MPLTMKKSLVKMFPIITPTIYYSIYSTNHEFRNRWLPAAMEVNKALELLTEYQSISKKIIKFHGAFIQNENDREKDVRTMMSKIISHDIKGEFNIVRYNPYSDEQGHESNNIEAISQIIGEYMPCKIIPRVGQDVYASCGTFLRGNTD